MKIVFFAFALILSSQAIGQKKHFDGMRLRHNLGMITALEAPLFAAPDKKSDIIQHVRKGEEIYVHPAEFQRDRYRGVISESPEKVSAYGEIYAEKFSDPLFDQKDVYRPEPDSLFYKTMAASGRDAYILKEHIFLLYHDLRELDQEVPAADTTDYRIEEPLPEGFPIIRPSGRRGYASLGLGIPSEAPYSHTSEIEDSGFDFLKEFNFAWSGNKEGITRRFFFGGMASLSLHETEYKLKGRTSAERNFKLSAGPYASYDIWRAESFILNVFGSAQFVFLDMLDVEQSATDGSDRRDSRSFTSYHLSPRAGLNIQKPKFFYALDFIAGAGVNMQFAHQYNTSDPADEETWWEGDKFDRPLNMQITYFLGLQSSY